MTTPLELELRKAEEEARPDRAPFEIPPGRVTRTMSIVPEPITIFRYMGPGDIADDAEGAVDRAAGSAGAPLPGDVRARFEQSLDADLSSVRVHTGGESAAAASAVGAYAYTHGQDIHFADGQYRPGDPFGLHLLAHEVAHTVQHTGGSVQRKQIMRDENKDAAGSGDKPALKDILEVTEFEFKKPSTVTAAPMPPDKVDMESPPIDLKATVTVKNDLASDKLAKIGSIKVGAIQNLVSSDRTGVYKKPDGTVVAEFKSQAGTSADAQTRDGDDTKRDFQDPPFYQRPDTITSQKISGTAYMHDKPGWWIPSTMSGGTLTETKGSDNFITAVAGKRDDELVQLQQESWSVPWAMQIDASKTGAGKPVDAKDTQDKAPITDPNAPIASANAKDWYSFKTVADAKAAPATTLLSSLTVARTKDPDSYKNIVQAITELNWKVGISVRCDSKFSLVMNDNMKVTLKGEAGNQFKPIDFPKGGTGEVTTFFTTIFNPETYADGMSITIMIEGESKTLTDTWAAPFASAGEKEMPGSDKHYFITKTGIK